MIKLTVGMILCVLIGAGCRWFDLPVPSPPKLGGVLLVAALTVGYMVTDRLIASKFSAMGPASTQGMCGGPTGDVILSSSLNKTA